MIKSIILLAIVACFVAQSEASSVIRLELHETGAIKIIAFAGDTVEDMKNAIRTQTDVEVDDQRLVNKGAGPIIDQELVSQLKVSADYKMPLVVLSDPLGEEGEVFIKKNRKKVSIKVKGEQTVGQLKSELNASKIVFEGLELTDDSQTLDDYQMGQKDFLDVTFAEKVSLN